MAPFTSTPTQFFISSSLTIQNHLILLFTVIIVTFSDGTTAQDHSSFFFLGFFSIYLRQCGNGHGRSNWGRAVTAARSRRVGSRGLDPELIEKLPTLVYSDVNVHKIGKGALECAVCPSEFEDDQMLRLLPICDHVFHTKCIDQWLESHTTCPVCRTNLAAVVDSPDYCRPLGRLLSVGRQSSSHGRCRLVVGRHSLHSFLSSHVVVVVPRGVEVIF